MIDTVEYGVKIMIVEDQTDQHDRAHRDGQFNDRGDESIVVVRVRETQLIHGDHQQHAEKAEETHDLANESTAMKRDSSMFNGLSGGHG